MKKSFSFLVIICLFMVGINNVSAFDGMLDGVYEDMYEYLIYPKGGWCAIKDIISPSQYTGAQKIPEKIRGYSVTDISNEAFRGCTSLTSVIMPNSIVRIGKLAFDGCTSLTNITIPSSVTSIGPGALHNCSDINVDDANEYYSDFNGDLYNKEKTMLIQYAGGKANNSFSVPNFVTAIGENAFYRSSLTNVTIPNSVTSIGGYAFYNCSGLTNVTIPNSVTSIGENAFCNCSGLTNVTMLDSVTSIGRYAFYNCSGLTNVTIPNSVTYIGEYAFSSCSGLTNVTIPNSVTYIYGYAFSNCSGLTNVTIPNSVTSIYARAFYNCSGLTNVTIPDSVTYIGGDAFYGCSGLTNVYYAGTKSDWANISIESGNSYLTSANIIYNCKEYIFITNGGSTVANIITNSGIEESPVTTYEGKMFLGWYDNEELSGEPVVFPYNGDKTTLYAKWSNKSDCYILQMLSPLGGKIVHNGEGEDGEISDLRVANSFDSITLDVEVSRGATWGLYYTKTASTPIADKTIKLYEGKSVTRYIKVQSEDQIHNKTYKITIYRQSKSAVPTISASGGTVTITAEAAGKIYYTTDKSDPSETNGTIYSKPFSAEPGTVIKAVAKADDKDELSDIVIYTVEDDVTVTVSPIMSEKTGGIYEYEFYVESPKAFNGIFVVAGYTQSGRLTEITRTVLGDNAAEYPVADSIKINADTAYYKYFLWSETNFIPLCEAQDITFDN